MFQRFALVCLNHVLRLAVIGVLWTARLCGFLATRYVIEFLSGMHDPCAQIGLSDVDAEFTCCPWCMFVTSGMFPKHSDRKRVHGSFFFLCGQSAVQMPSAHTPSGTGLFPTACRWLYHPAAMTGISAAERGNDLGECDCLFCFFPVASGEVHDASSLRMVAGPQPVCS